MDLLADDVVARSPRDLNTQRPPEREIHYLSELRLSVGKGFARQPGERHARPQF